MSYEPVIGLEVHVELLTRTKMFCACPVVDPTRVEPNRAVCEICMGLPGTLPVVNRQAVELALRVALALGSRLAGDSLFARKNYFYPDLPKGYQISQYESPLASGGSLALPFPSAAEEGSVRIRRVHLEEDTGKLVHRGQESLVDYNRAGVPLLEIVTEPDLTSVEQAKAFATELRSLLRTLGVTSGDMEKGAIRFEANVSVRPAGSDELGTRTEVKNLNSFRAMVRAVTFEVERQTRLRRAGQPVEQETRGWDEARGETLPQRNKEDAHDYRYFPEPDLPPLHIDPAWIEQVRQDLPELPAARRRRLSHAFDLPAARAAQLVEDPRVADYFERSAAAAPAVPPARLASWLTGELFGLLHASDTSIEACRVSPESFAELVAMVEGDYLSPPTAKALLQRLFESGGRPSTIAEAEGLAQVTDVAAVDQLVEQVLRDNPAQVRQYQGGKRAVAQWLFGQVMRRAGGRAKPGLVQERLQSRLDALPPAPADAEPPRPGA
ncbi:MAG TPA: Asp-tRNA(Asn)/Glu-tRNA(Gln) amidotransferase subunit GatB [Anaerolineales bacterium]|nr:Asp-tRNA(Asn)/Glu-tRNA(Gln) amidotransferase subunit GatB [Anaerolineales bacterium]